MNRLLLVCLTVLVRFCLSQDPVPIVFQTDPFLAQTGTDVLFTITNLPDVVLVKWNYPGGTTPLALWSGGVGTLNLPSQYQGRVSVTRNQLRISNAQLADAGSYEVEVDPSVSTGLAPNSKPVRLRVFVAVSGVSLAVPLVAVEGSNISLTCTWATGTEVAVAWGFKGAPLSSGGRVSISGGSLVIDPGRRADAGEYSCTVSNPVSVGTTMQTLTVYYGPDTPVLTKDRPVDCVGGGDAVLGQTVTLTCTSESLPPALFSWQQDGRPVAAVQPDSGVLGVQVVSANQSGRYTCLARNAITAGQSEQSTEVDVVQTCLSGGEVAGIVIGSLAALLLIILLILLLLRWRRRADPTQRDYPRIQRTDQVSQPVPPVSSALGNREAVQVSDPPLHQPNLHYTVPQQYNRHPPNNSTLLRGSNPPPPYHHHQGNGRLLPSAAADPPNGLDNLGFSHSAGANTLSRAPPQNPNILVQGATQDGAQPPTVQVNLGPQPGGATGTLPTMHFNLNSYPPTAQPLPLQTAPGSEGDDPPPPAEPRRSDGEHRRQRSDPATRVFGREDPAGRSLAPSGYSRGEDTGPRAHPAHRHADAHGDRRGRGPSSRSGDGGQAGPHSRGHTPSLVQAPWDLLRGTPAYPNHATSDDSDYTAQNPPLPQTRASEPRRVNPEGRGGQEVVADARRARARPSPSQSRHSRDAPRAQSQARSHSPRQVATETATVPRGHVTQQRPITTRSLDTRALADPNHLLPQTRPSQPLPQTRPSQPLPQTVVAPPTTQRHQGQPSPRSNGTLLTQEALQTHTQRSQTFQNRNQQTQAALNQPQQTQAALNRPQQTQAALNRPPTPPQVIPMAQFQALPRERTHDRSPGRPAPRPTANLPAGQRLHLHANNHPHHPRNTGHAPHGHHANRHQNQARRERPR